MWGMDGPEWEAERAKQEADRLRTKPPQVSEADSLRRSIAALEADLKAMKRRLDEITPMTDDEADYVRKMYRINEWLFQARIAYGLSPYDCTYDQRLVRNMPPELQ